MAVASPFATQLAPAAGAGMTPSLQNPYMLAHPPLRQRIPKDVSAVPTVPVTSAALRTTHCDPVLQSMPSQFTPSSHPM